MTIYVSEDGVWCYFQNEKSIGPLSKDQLLQLVFIGEISRETLICNSVQIGEWQPICEVFDLNQELPPPLPEIQLSEMSNFCIPLESVRPHPWRRYFARTLDIVINVVIVWLAVYVILNAIAPREATRLFNFIEKTESTVAYLVAIFLTGLISPFISAAFIGFTGSSVGKFLFGVRIVDSSDKIIGYWVALKREFLVWIFGLGCGIPGLAAVVSLCQYLRLNKNKITSWDRELSLKVVYRRDGLIQRVLALLGFLLLYALYALTRDMV